VAIVIDLGLVVNCPSIGENVGDSHVRGGGGTAASLKLPLVPIAESLYPDLKAIAFICVLVGVMLTEAFPLDAAIKVPLEEVGAVGGAPDFHLSWHPAVVVEMFTDFGVANVPEAGLNTGLVIDNAVKVPELIVESFHAVFSALAFSVLPAATLTT
jgi:hypothetical protein